MQLHFHPRLLVIAFTFFGISSNYAQQLISVTSGVLVTDPSGSRSCNFLDFNNDHFQDILITNGTQGGEDNLLYLNDGTGGFALVQDTIGNDGMPSDGATCADYDNDGFVDVYVGNWYNTKNLLYRNSTSGSFERIGSGSIANDLSSTETASWGDYDNDGWLDLYVANSAGSKKNFLYRNLGDGTFERITTGSHVNDAYLSRCVNWIDYDLDGDQDLFVTNENNQVNHLYRNDGNGNFTKIITGALVADNFSTMSASWADIDNDGDFDVFLSNYDQNNQCFLNDGNGNFTAHPGVWDQETGCSFSSSFADYDNDADLDLFVTNGYCGTNLNNFLYDNNGDGTFTKNLIEAPAIATGSSYGCAWGDINNDGFQELVVANWANENQENSLYLNNGNNNHWIAFELHGTVSNALAIGAIIRCQATINGNIVWQMREVSAQSGYCSQNSLVAHFGLGSSTSIETVVIQWPSGIVQQFGNLGTDQMFAVYESGEIGVLGSIELPGQEEEPMLYPNPSNGEIHIQTGKFGATRCKVEILNSLGQIVYAQSHDPQTESIVLSITALQLAGGMYSICLTGNGTQTTLPLLIPGKP